MVMFKKKKLQEHGSDEVTASDNINQLWSYEYFMALNLFLSKPYL
jgi:hypothetical protein